MAPIATERVEQVVEKMMMKMKMKTKVSDRMHYKYASKGCIERMQ